MLYYLYLTYCKDYTEGRVIFMLRKMLPLVLLVMFVSKAIAADKFIYGIHMFNRTVDYDMREQGFPSESQRDAIYDRLIKYAADIDEDILVRGGSRYSELSTQTYRGWGANGIYGMENYLFPTFRKYGIKNLDWVLVSTYSGELDGIQRNDRDMNADIVRTVYKQNDIYGWPPKSARWKSILSKISGFAKSKYSGIHIKYEIWNEPDINDT